MPSFTPGHDPTIVYIVNEGTAGTIKIFNLTTGQKTELAKNSRAVVNEAQVSTDGQWVLFAITIAGQSELRLVRLDGKEQQTLLCAPAGESILHSQWSYNQKYVIFDEGPTSYLLNMQTGALNIEVPAQSNNISLIPRTWLDNTHVLMAANATDELPQNISILDITRGGNQSLSSISKVFDSSSYPTCWGFDSSFDGKTLFITECSPGNPGSSTIVKETANGGAPSTLLNSSTLVINTVRVVDSNSAHLLALAADVGQGGNDGDPQHDGLYLFTTSNDSLQRLTTTSAGEYSSLNAFSQDYWSNVSRDGQMYALETDKPDSNEYTLSYGSLSGGTPTVFGDISNTVLEMAGWTTT